MCFFGCQVSASFDALIDIAGGKINIHVLMALAAFASVFMGNSLEGGLLLAMFNLSHIGIYLKLTHLDSGFIYRIYKVSCLTYLMTAAEEFFTSRSKVDVKELKENYPDVALVLESNNENLFNFSDLKYHEIPVNDLEVGSYILVKAGEVCKCMSINLVCSSYAFCCSSC